MDKQKEKLEIEKEVHLLMAYKNRYEDQEKLIEEYKLPKLTMIAATLIDNREVFNKKFGYTKNEIDWMIEQLLSGRRRRLNADFQWTEESRTRFKTVNDELFDACEKGWEEALDTAKALEERIKAKDVFLKDYEIDVTITAYPKLGGKREAAEVLGYHLGEDYHCSRVGEISHSRYKHDTDIDSLPMTVDKNVNSNIEYFDGEFRDDYICYTIHQMLDSHIWSFPDILSICVICVDVKVEHQYDKRLKNK